MSSNELFSFLESNNDYNDNDADWIWSTVADKEKPFRGRKRNAGEIIRKNKREFIQPQRLL